MYRELCKTHYREYRKQWAKTHAEKLAKWHKENDATRSAWRNWLHHERIATAKWLVFTHYGGNPPKCDCCDETAFEFLCIDHINGGEKHRKEVGAGIRFYKWLIKNTYPEGFRVLCHNCNMALGFYGYCPHNADEPLS